MLLSRVYMDFFTSYILNDAIQVVLYADYVIKCR